MAEALVKYYPVPMEFIGISDTFGESGKPAELAEKYGLTAQHIAAAAKRAIERKKARLH